MTHPPEKPDPLNSRRGVRITAWAVGLLAVGIYATFLLAVMLP